MVRDIPEMIRSGYINQAFEAEKIVASTFDFSEEFLEKLGGIPQNYIERMQDIYSDLLQRAFNAGFKTAEVKSRATPLNLSLPEKELNRELEIKIPMPYGTKQDFVNTFREEIKVFLESIPCGEEQLSIQFNKDLEAAFKEGVKEFIREVPAKAQEPIPEPALDPIKEPAFAEIKEIKDVEAKLILNVWDKFATSKLLDIFESNYENARHRVNAKMVKNFADWMVAGKKAREFLPKDNTNTATAEISKETLDHLEKYVKLLGSGEAEMVLRFVMGLGTKGTKPKKKKNNKTEAFVEAAKKKDKDDKDEDKDKKEDKKDKDDKDNKDNKDDKKGKGKEKEKESKVTDKSSNTSNTIKKLEEYTKLLNNPLAEKVLRYTLGLPPTTATASFKATGRQIGIYDTQVLKQRILELLRSHNMNTDDDFQTIIIECIASGVLEMDEQEASKVVSQKLGFEGPLTLGEVEDRADSLANELDVSLGLPGDLVFLITDEGDFCLTYNFNRNDIFDLDIELEKEEEEDRGETVEDNSDDSDDSDDIDMEDNLPEEENEEDEFELELEIDLDKDEDEEDEEDEEEYENKKVGASLPTPLSIDQQQSAFSKREQEEIAALLNLGKSKTYKDIKRASPTMADFISDVLARIRNGKLSLTEGANILKSNIEDLISDCFGTEGQGYFQYLKNKGASR